MATTGSSGLNNLLTDTNVVQTTLPTWYSDAQQNIGNQASTALGAAPAFGQTTSQQAVNTLQGQANPFTQAQGSLNTIASGAANPWLVSDTGQVTPNVNTAMGGLFSAQRDQLNQLMPTTIAPQQAGAIGSGNFGSLRGQTSVDKAKTDAFDTLAAQQMQSALSNQQAGASAGSALGNVGAQGISADLTSGQAQMNAPFQGLGNYANLINAINVPATVSQQNQASPLSLMGSLSTAPAAVGNLISSLGLGTGTLKSIGSGLTQWLSGQTAAANEAGGTGGVPNPYANMTDAQIQYAIDNGFGSNPTPEQIASIPE